VSVASPVALEATGSWGCGALGAIHARAGGATVYTLNGGSANGTGDFLNLAAGIYQVRATRADGCFAERQVVLTATPTPPVITDVYNITASSAVVRWGAVAGATRYTLRYRVAGAPVWTVIQNIVATQQFLTGLQQGTTYEVEVAYSCGDGALSDFGGRTFTTQGLGDCAGTPVAVPGGLYVSAVTGLSATFRWNAVAGAAGYIVAVGAADANPATWPQYVVCAPQTELTVGGLSYDRDYRVRVRTNCSNCITALDNNDRRSDWTQQVGFHTLALRQGAAAPGGGLEAYPNPNNGAFVARFAAQGPTTLRLLDVTGRALWMQHVAADGLTEVPCRLDGFAPGVYVLDVVGVGTVRVVVCP